MRSKETDVPIQSFFILRLKRNTFPYPGNKQRHPSWGQTLVCYIGGLPKETLNVNSIPCADLERETGFLCRCYSACQVPSYFLSSYLLSSLPSRSRQSYKTVRLEESDSVSGICVFLPCSDVYMNTFRQPREGPHSLLSQALALITC